MNKHDLICHAITPDSVVKNFHAAFQVLPDGRLQLIYELTGNVAALLIPAQQPPAAVDGLWQHSCFEAFISTEDSAEYHEFNFSPSSQWAAYAFNDYRVRNEDWIASQAPVIRFVQTDNHLQLEAIISLDDLPPNETGKPFCFGMTAVIEAKDGTLSYWALHHVTIKPDFHHRDGFALRLPKTSPSLQNSAPAKVTL